MEKIIITLISFVFITGAYSQVSVKTDVNYKSHTFDVFQVLIDTSTLKNFSILENKSYTQHSGFIKNGLSNSEYVFITNASIVDSTCKPLGWYVNGGIELHDINRRDGQGNFYLKPNGALLIYSDSAKVIQTDSLVDGMINPIIGIQSGPMLVTSSSINKSFNPNSINRFIRSGVGLTRSNGNDVLIFAISLQPVNFYEFASFFEDRYKCTDALCLESAGSVMKLPFYPNFTDNSTHTVCRYLQYTVD